MKITVVKDWRGQEEIHKAGCADLRKNKQRPYRLSEALTMDVENLGDLYRVYWECIDDEAVAEGTYPTKEAAWYAWTGEFDVKPCASSVPEMPEPGTEPAKVSKSDAKNDLARRLVLAAEAMVKGLDESDAALSGLSREEAAQFVANWLHSLPTGGRDGARWWGTELPKPATADWKK